LIERHQDHIERLAKELLEKETLDLLDIVSILGERPFPMTESIKDYMKEIEIRKKDRLEKEEAEKNKIENVEEKESKASEEVETKVEEDVQVKSQEQK
jgi:AFG3 family protein